MQADAAMQIAVARGGFDGRDTVEKGIAAAQQLFRKRRVIAKQPRRSLKCRSTAEPRESSRSTGSKLERIFQVQIQSYSSFRF